jgi:hypothetical protein
VGRERARLPLQARRPGEFGHSVEGRILEAAFDVDRDRIGEQRGGPVEREGHAVERAFEHDRLRCFGLPAKEVIEREQGEVERQRAAGEVFEHQTAVTKLQGLHAEGEGQPRRPVLLGVRLDGGRLGRGRRRRADTVDLDRVVVQPANEDVDTVDGETLDQRAALEDVGERIGELDRADPCRRRLAGAQQHGPDGDAVVPEVDDHRLVALVLDAEARELPIHDEARERRREHEDDEHEEHE